MYDSGEGVGTKTRYWLELGVENGSNVGTNVSPPVDVIAGNGSVNSGRNYYVRAESTANRKNVRLTAENNNYSSNTYSVTGIWDEETGRVLPGQYNTYYTTAYDK